MNCAIIGATGYTGMELAKILLRHSEVKLTHLTTRQEKPVALRSLIPQLPKEITLEVAAHSPAEIKRRADVVFICLPHTEAAKTAAEFYRAGKIVIDLSADYRLKKAKDYEAAYGIRHPEPALLRESVYGMTELFREKIRKAGLIANPGCYPTGATLGLAPLLKRHLIQPELIIDSKSGISGAGKKLTASSMFGEMDGNFYAYKVNRHQHAPEMKQTMETLGGRKVSLTFVPHVLPVFRGILSVMYLQKKPGVTARQIAKAYEEDYGVEPFVRFLGENKFPALKDVQLTNFCDIGFTLDARSGRLIVISAIDNLVKGAAGQAVQNMNVRCSFPEEEGLRS